MFELLAIVKRIEAEQVRPLREDLDTASAVIVQAGQLREACEARVAPLCGGGGEAGGLERYGVNPVVRLGEAGVAARVIAASIDLQTSWLLRRGVEMPFCLRFLSSACISPRPPKSFVTVACWTVSKDSRLPFRWRYRGDPTGMLAAYFIRAAALFLSFVGHGLFQSDAVLPAFNFRFPGFSHPNLWFENITYFPL